LQTGYGKMVTSFNKWRELPDISAKNKKNQKSLKLLNSLRNFTTRKVRETSFDRLIDLNDYA